MDPVSPLLDIDNLSVRYGQVEAVREVSLRVLPGEFVSIIGNNGAGKSSTLKAIAGVVKPASGTIKFAGTNIDGLPSHRIVRLGISLVPEGRLIFADLTVRDNLMLGGYTRVTKANGAFEDDLERMFAMFPILKQRLGQLAGSLSGGEQQMLALARGLLARPKLLMIDEMSLGLAPRVLETLFPVLEKLNREGLAILLVEQLATLALKAANRGYVFENSRIILRGSAIDLAKNPQVVEAYLGRRASE
ncbi:MAG: ABC transporter ATP-binding protein [Methyloligellaceae bacterium]